MTTADDERYMRLAIQSAHQARREGNDPYGSVVVRSGDVVEGHNTANTMCDPTAHAELVAIRNAASAWASVDLRGATLYASFEPCPMCLGAILASGISELVIGARRTSGEPPLGNYTVEGLLALAGQSQGVTVRTGVLERDAQAVVSQT